MKSYVWQCNYLCGVSAPFSKITLVSEMVDKFLKQYLLVASQQIQNALSLILQVLQPQNLVVW